MADAAAEQRVSIPVFTGKPEAFPQWCFVMRMHLRRLNLVRCIEADQHQAHPNDDSRAYTEICFFLREEAISVVREVPEGRGFLAWTALITRFQGSIQDRESSLQTSIGNLRWTREHTVNSFRDEFLELRRALIALGPNSALPDKFLCNLLLGQLPPRFSNVVVHFRSPAQAPAHDANFHQRLISIFDLAFQVEHVEAKNEGKEVHAGLAAVASRPAMECHYCHRSGHIEAECRTKVRHEQERTGNRPAKKNRSRSQQQHTAFSALLSPPLMQSHFAIDSGATTHLSGNKNLFANLEDISSTRSVDILVADGRTVRAEGRGNIHLVVPTSKGNRRITLLDVLYVPGIASNLLSTRKIMQAQAPVRITVDASSGRAQWHFTDDNSTVSLVHDDLMWLPTVREQSVALAAKATELTLTQEYSDYQLAHERLGHCHDDLVRAVFPHIIKPPNHLCIACETTKASRTSVSTAPVSRNAAPGTFIHADVLGPLPVSTFSGKRFAVTFTDDATRLTTVFLMTRKSEVPACFHLFLTSLALYPAFKVKVLHSDGASEFSGKEMQALCARFGIRQQFSPPHTPQRNGVAERLNRTLQESARAMLAAASLSDEYWGAALLHAALLKNIVPHSTTKQIPWTHATGRAFDHRLLHRFGSPCFVHVPDTQRNKLQARARLGVWLGIDLRSMSHLVRLVDTNRTVSSIHVSIHERATLHAATRSPPVEREVTVFTDVPGGPAAPPVAVGPPVAALPPPQAVAADAPLAVPALVAAPPVAPAAPAPPPTQALPAPAFLPHVVNVPMPRSFSSISSPAPAAPAPAAPSASSTPVPRRATPQLPRRVTPTLPARDEGERTFQPSRASQRLQDRHKANIAIDIREPTSLAEALRSEEWKHALMEEIAALEKNGTWEYVLRSQVPNTHKVLPCKVVWKLKRRPDGSVDRYKARIVVGGHRQKAGIDYNLDEIFAPTLTHTALRCILSHAASHGWHIHSCDVKGAFLYGDLKELVYMEVPPTLPNTDKDGNELVFRLRRSLYGLHQAPKVWETLLSETMGKLGFNRFQADPCVYGKDMRTERAIVIGIFVDDVVVTSPLPSIIDQFKKDLQMHFEITDNSEISGVLGINVNYNRAECRIRLTQTGYAASVLERFGMEDSKPVSTPLVPNTTLSKTDEDGKSVPSDKAWYASVVGSLMYLAVATRPDLSYAVGCLARFMSDPCEHHIIAAKRVLRYLCGTKNLGLTYGSTGTARDQLLAYCDADYAQDPDTRKSTTGLCFLMNGGAISWSSKRQSTVSTSTAEAEYTALFSGTQEARFLAQLLAELGLPTKAITMHCDNQPAIHIANNPVTSSHSKHFDVRLHYIREQVQAGTIGVKHIATESMIADMMTKSLDRIKFEKHRASALGHTGVTDEGEC